MKSHEELITRDAEWHESHEPSAFGVSAENAVAFKAGFVSGERQALSLCAKFPDWEEVAEKLMDALTIYGEILDDMPTGIDDMIADPVKSARVDEAFEAYKSAHFMLSSHESVVE